MLAHRFAVDAGLRPAASTTVPAGELTLCDAPLGRTARIVAVEAGGDRLRLAELGLRRGALVTVLRRTAGGGRLLAIGADRIAVDRATAQRVSAVPL